MADKSGNYAYHFTCIDNLPSIIEHGLLSTSEKLKLKINHRNVANMDIQRTRSTMEVPCGPGGVVHDYVPFYFSKKTPMQLSLLLSKNYDQFDFIYFAIPVDEIKAKDVVFTDGSANRQKEPNFFSHYSDKDKLNWEIIKRAKWGGMSEGEKHEKMAELLILKKVEISRIHHINVLNQYVEKKVKPYFNGFGNPRIYFDQYHFFCKPPEFKYSLITGPKSLKDYFKEAMEDILDAPDPVSPNFSTLKEMIFAIEEDFSCISELNAIEGLKPSKGGLHIEEVGEHSRTVVENIKNNSLFSTLEKQHQKRLILAGYLHDIGKGASQKDGEYISNPDHAKDSLPMLKRILTDEISKRSKHCIRQILLLVTYDDLIGDIVKTTGYQRNKQQLFDLIENKTELTMLRILAEADIQAVNFKWYSDTKDKIEDLYNETIEELGL